MDPERLDVEDLRICHGNTQSLLAHFDEFRLYFLNENYHIICLSETWLKPSMSMDMVSLPGCSLFRHDRIGRGGGGVAVYVVHGIRVKLLTTSDELYCKKPEYLLLEIICGDVFKLLLGVVYRLPNCCS